MTVHLNVGAAEQCVSLCDQFVGALQFSFNADLIGAQRQSAGAFDTARQIGTVYSLFAGEDLRTLLNGYVDQAKAMSMLFAAAGGLIEAQDQAVAAALGKAAQEPAGLQSLGLLGSLGSMSAMLDAADGRSTPGGYDRVGPEEVSGAPLARMVSGAQALEPGQFAQVSERVGTVAAELQTAAAELQQGLGDALGSQWQGEFATQASTSVGSFTSSVTDLATVLEQVAAKAGIAENGFSTTRSRITDESVSFQAVQLNTPGFGPVHGPATPASTAAMAAAKAAAEEQARAIVNTVYSPAVMDANLADLDIPSPYRVVSSSALGGAGGVDLASVWNVDGVGRSAGAAAPSTGAILAAGGGGNVGVAGGADADAGAGAGAGAVGGGAGPGATTTTLSAPATDAATEQARLASRGGAVDGGGAAAASAGHGGAGGANAGGLNAATTAAGTPFMPGAAVNGQPGGAGAGAAGTRGIRNGAGQRNRDRGFGSAAGILGGSGATAAGAGAARMGGAGTLAGFGAPGGPGLGGPGAGGLSGGSGAAGGPAGSFSSSSTGGAQAGRAGMMPMGMMGAAGAGQNDGRRGHTPAGYLTNATNASEIVGDPVKVAPAVLGRTTPAEDVTAEPDRKADDPSPGRVIGRGFTGGGAAPR